ncbi:MAG: hypothetical protein ACI835_002538 [Planctomycetota bacterium]|jgi:hypothetical protein
MRRSLFVGGEFVRRCHWHKDLRRDRTRNVFALVQQRSEPGKGSSAHGHLYSRSSSLRSVPVVW